MQNRNFVRVQKEIQRYLPVLGVAVILIVYAVTAVSMGAFLHARMSTAGALPYFIAYGTGIGAQLTRFYVVFNSQVNYGSPSSSFFAYVFGAVLTVYTGFEAWHLEPEFFVSIVHIVGAGYIVEIQYLRHLDRASAYQLLNDDTLRNEYINFERRLRELRDFQRGEDRHDAGLKNGVDFDGPETVEVDERKKEGNERGNPLSPFVLEL